MVPISPIQLVIYGFSHCVVPGRSIAVARTMYSGDRIHSTIKTDHAQQRTRPAHPNIVKRTQGLAMPGSGHIDKNNHFALKPLEIPNLCKTDGMATQVAR